MYSLILWYILITILGWISFPLTYRMLPALKDRGYASSRALGLILWSFIFWLLASLGILRNEAGGLLFSLALVISLSIYVLRQIDLQELLEWLHSQLRLIISVELLFLLAFAGWALVRSTNPEAIGTEKPMELAFINAILRSPTFPPHDPWLSGYAISYYYFGYVMVAMLAKLTSTSGGVAFNLGVSLVFALSAIGSFGLIYDLLNQLISGKDREAKPRFIFSSILGPLFVLVISNLEGFLDVLHARGIFWQRGAAGELTSSFWKWLNIKDLNIPPQEPFSWIPTRFWWWWRASRVLQDYDLAGNVKEIIDEFPFFSYLLADLHPHVLAMPFALLALTLAFNVISIDNQEKSLKLRLHFSVRSLAWVGTLFAAGGVILTVYGAFKIRTSLVSWGITVGSSILNSPAIEPIVQSVVLFGLGIMGLVCSSLIYTHLRYHHTSNPIDLLLRGDWGEISAGATIDLDWLDYTLTSIILGGMAFLNTWDFPLYVALFAAAYAFGKVRRQEIQWSKALREFIWIGFVLGITGGVLYLPFYFGFSSQAGGVLPNLIYSTRGAHLWVMFAPLLIPIFTYLIYLSKVIKNTRNVIRGVKLASGLMIGLWLFSLFLGLVILIFPQAGEVYQASLAASGTPEIFNEALWRRFSNPGGWITLLFLLALTSGLLFSLNKDSEDDAKATIYRNPSHIFALLLVLSGALMVIGAEFFYLRDMFGWRMNTIFKFYFQSWIIWSIAAAYCSAVLLVRLGRCWNTLFSIGFSCLLIMSLAYPALSLWTKTGGFDLTERTLDSTAYLIKDSPDEVSAIEWLKHAPYGVVVEAVPEGGGSYTQYGRVSTLSGLPAVLGWVGHENQWRGGNQIFDSRQGDIERLYCSRDWTETRIILDQYKIRYVFVSNLERATYTSKSANCSLGLVDVKFIRNLNPVFEQGSVTIYEYISLPD